MKSPLGILVLGILGAAGAYFVASQFHASQATLSLPTASNAIRSDHAASHATANPTSDLAWLRAEFHLDGPTFDRIRRLHEAYRPRCEDLCRRIDAHNRRLQVTLLAATGINDETRGLLEEGNRLRTECHVALAAHLVEVAQCMPPVDGRRYLELMLPATGIIAASHPISDFTHAPPHE